MGRSALGKSLTQIQEEQQPSFNFIHPAKTHGPETSHIAAEKITASGKREQHCRLILDAMHRLNATVDKPVTGALIAKETGLEIVQVMRRLAVDLETPGLIGRGDKMLCEVTRAQRLGWFLK